jgi:hypothetical protein
LLHAAYFHEEGEALPVRGPLDPLAIDQAVRGRRPPGLGKGPRPAPLTVIRITHARRWEGRTGACVARCAAANGYDSPLFISKFR